MARYIDKQALLEWLEYIDLCLADGTVEAPTLYKQMMTDIKNFGEADVVPREEVERLIDLVKELQEYNEAWVENNVKLRAENKNLKKYIGGDKDEKGVKGNW